MKRISEYIAYTLAAGSGLALWIVIPAITGNPEAWDSGIYYRVGMPLITAECMVLGYIIPTSWWQWGLVVAVPQAIFIIIKWPTSNLMPLAVVFQFILSAPYFLGGFLGARLNKKFNQNKSSNEMSAT